ncbi:MAG: hypothetical protein ACMVY4_07990 [Minwuia sp.]|uniref:hypothetical protein n=1 Tax=Minwuia sp. TaxID=2493630 RepID=UPI003A837B48
MGGFFPNPRVPEPDTSALDDAREREEREAARLEAQNEARIRNLRARRSGRRALLAFSDRNSGNGGDGLQTTLG